MSWKYVIPRSSWRISSFRLLRIKHHVFLWQRKLWKLLCEHKRLKCRNCWGFCHPYNNLKITLKEISKPVTVPHVCGSMGKKKGSVYKKSPKEVLSILIYSVETKIKKWFDHSVITFRGRKHYLPAVFLSHSWKAITRTKKLK